MMRRAARRFLHRFRSRLRRLARRAVSPGAILASLGSGSATFSRWMERSSERFARGYPDAWDREDMRLDAPARLGIVLHVFYPDLLGEILRGLAAVPVAFDLIVTNASGTALDITTSSLPQAKSVRILNVENRGRDLWPLAQIVNAGILDPYDLILKLHTKQSAWRDDHEQLPGSGSAWRQALLASLLGGTDNIKSILTAFAVTPELGMVTADGSVLGPQFWGSNEKTTSHLLRRLELELRPGELRFAAGSMYWTRGFVIQGLRALGLTADDFEREARQVDGTTAHAIERLLGLLTVEAGLTIHERSDAEVRSETQDAWRRFEPIFDVEARVRVFPFYLPQYHPIPENDRWWGAGFTEWSNVAAAKPVFTGHYQPKLPTDTGFYDLRLHESVALQADLARAAGVAGWMYYYYWFAGRPLLDRPIQARLVDDIQLPFCLMWANENWTRRWDGRDDEVLVGQRYEEVDSSRFLEDVLPILKDPRYLRVEGRPLVAIYRPGQIPNLERVTSAWRELARREGIGELLLISVDVSAKFDGLTMDSAAGLDGTLGFPPHSSRWVWVDHWDIAVDPDFEGNILSYRATVEESVRKMRRGIPESSFPGVMVAFDNTARRQKDPDIWFGANPYTFHRWLLEAARSVADREPDRRLVFVNAWNEWAEGAALEPNTRFGSTFLLAVRSVAYS